MLLTNSLILGERQKVALPPPRYENPQNFEFMLKGPTSLATDTTHFLCPCYIHHPNKINPRYFSLAATARKPQQISMFLHISARVWGRRWSHTVITHIRTEGFYVKTAIIHQLKRLCVEDCAYTESMFINFIHISLYDISLMRNILYQIKRDAAVWKRLGCPQRKQRTWWQIVATPYTGLA